MKERKNLCNPRLNGSVKIKRIPRSEWSKTKADHLIKSESIIRWEPPYQIARQLPEGFAIEFECVEDKDGVRRFLPIKPCGAFAFEAALAGHAILADRGKEKAEESQLSLHEGRLFNQFSRCLREYLGETLKLGRLLNISRAGRPDGATKDVLPEDVGLDAAGNGERWSVAKFKENGIVAAKAAGISNPTPDEIAWFGLYEAANRNPLRTSDAEAEDLVRLAFYTLGPEAKIDSDVVEYVAEHVRASLKNHRKDSTDDFDQWIKDPKSNLINRIAKRKDCRWTRDEIRTALLELGWRSFKMLARSIDACMRALAAALPNPLTKEEKKLFARMYLAHRDFGGIPLVLLQDRFAVIKRAILAIWQNPGSRKAVGVLRRLIWMYAEIVGTRRAGDRQYKRQSSQRNKNDRPAIDMPLFEEAQVTPDETKDVFKEAAIRTARANGYSCDFAGATWDARVVIESKKVVVLDITCPARRFAETVSISRKDFAKIAIAVQKEISSEDDASQRLPNGEAVTEPSRQSSSC